MRSGYDWLKSHCLEMPTEWRQRLSWRRLRWQGVPDAWSSSRESPATDDREPDGRHHKAIGAGRTGYSKNWGTPWICPRSVFSQNFKGLLFGWTLWIYLPNLKFVALSVPEIMGILKKIWGVPGFAYPAYSPKFLKGFCSHRPCEYTCQVWSS